MLKEVLFGGGAKCDHRATATLLLKFNGQSCTLEGATAA